MVKIGVPAGVQGMLFSISNVLIQSSVNSFGAIVMAGNTASLNIENFVYNFDECNLSNQFKFYLAKYGSQTI